jgi:EAL domain-containing protein (putative c-di-GMP-specific phosphodiesterase class I)
VEHGIAPPASQAAPDIDADTIRSALARGEFSFHYQPLVSVPDREIVGYEALVRWVQPGGSLVFPDAFMDAITTPPLSHEFDAYAVEEGVRTARRLRGFGRSGVAVSVNVSAESLTQSGFVDVVCRWIGEADLVPGALTLEILETTRPNESALAPALDRLRAVGARIALDDFGSGYSNLDLLLSLPVDIVKLDRRLIASGPAALPVLEAMTSLAHRLGLVVVVEGVETLDHWDVVTGIGADVAQGYLLGGPEAFSG